VKAGGQLALQRRFECFRIVFEEGTAAGVSRIADQAVEMAQRFDTLGNDALRKTTAGVLIDEVTFSAS
jgi:hypothetical protein